MTTAGVKELKNISS